MGHPVDEMQRAQLDSRRIELSDPLGHMYRNDLG